jgi:hypothetical protein
MTGAFFFSLVHRSFGQRKRWVLGLSFTLQALMTAAGAALITTQHASDSPVKKPSVLALPADPGFPWIDLVPIGLLAFQASGKVTASRVLQLNALPTVVLTTLYNDLMGDPGLFTGGLLANVQRNRRLGGVVFYFGGAVAAGPLVKSTLGYGGLLWIAAGVKMLIAGAWLIWREEVESERD